MLHQGLLKERVIQVLGRRGRMTDRLDDGLYSGKKKRYEGDGQAGEGSPSNRQAQHTDIVPSRRTRKTGRLLHCDSLVGIRHQMTDG